MKINQEMWEQLYNESTQLIDNSPNLTTNKIPDHLLCVWLYRGENGYHDPSFELSFSVAIYKYANDKYGDSELSSPKGQRQYEQMQYILATEYICRKISGRLRPYRIFNFAKYGEPLDIDLTRKQMAKYQRLASTLTPLHNQGSFIVSDTPVYPIFPSRPLS